MVSVATARASGLGDPRWTNRDKFNQVQGLLNLKKRDLKQASFDAESLLKSQCNEMKELRREIAKYRLLLEAANQGDPQRIRNTLRVNRAAQLALRDKPISAAIDYLEETNFVKCKELNSLRYKKIKLMRTYLNLKLETSRLQSKIAEHQSERPDVKKEQRLTNLVSRTAVKQDAAQCVYFTYRNIVAVLKEDEKYFGPALNMLNQELMEQCKAVLKVTGKGQKVMEEAADIKDECRRYEEKLKMLMHDRSEAVNQMRHKVHHHRGLCKALVRGDSSTAMLSARGARQVQENSTEDYARQLQKMESIMQKLRNATLVEKTDEIFPRMKYEKENRERLKKVVARNARRRDKWLTKRNHAEVMRDRIKHNMEEFTVEYKKQKAELLEQIREKRDQQRSAEIEMEKLGRFMVSLRAALYTISAVLDHVREPAGTTEKSVPPEYRWNPEDDWLEQLYARKFEPDKQAPKENAMKLVQKMYFKLWLLTEQLSGAKLVVVSDHLTYSLVPEVVVENPGRGDEADEQLSSSILDADLDNDPSVPTRAKILANSKKIVDYNLKLPEMKPDRKPRKARPDETKYWCPRPSDT